jgi:hypothetical protein
MAPRKRASTTTPDSVEPAEQKQARVKGPRPPKPPKKLPTGRYIFCPGSGVAHDQVIIEIWRGPAVAFYRCPIPTCNIKGFLVGPGWYDHHAPKILAPDGNMVPPVSNRLMTREDALRANPNATIF